MAQSIIKKLDKLERIEDVEIRKAQYQALTFKVDKQPGRVLCTLKHISKSFGECKDSGKYQCGN
jgi:ATP-binding cassette subfamily F protein 3